MLDADTETDGTVHGTWARITDDETLLRRLAGDVANVKEEVARNGAASLELLQKFLKARSTRLRIAAIENPHARKNFMRVDGVWVRESES